ncbi:MAG: DUF308 domain-containing protein [Methanoregulaceae archaeon]|nr:DUF308 domain-containing protein [Methanoregulaceae archaeon]
MPDSIADTSSKGSPGWLRVLEILAGLVLIFTSLYVWVYPGIAALTYVFIFGIALVFLGIARIGGAFFFTAASGGMRILAGIIGVLCVVIGFYAAAFPLVGALTMAYFFAFALMMAGIDRLALAGSAGGAADAPSWLKYLSIFAGLVALIVSFAIILYPGFGVALVFVLISLEIFLLGIELVASGATGRNVIGF